MTRPSSRHRAWAPVLLGLLVGACGGDPEIVPAPTPVPADPTVRTNSGFENLSADADGSFSIGTAPVLAKFTGGTLADTNLARNGEFAWLIDEGKTGEIRFRSPVSEFVLWFGHQDEPQVVAVPPGDAQARCEVQDKPPGLDDSAPFVSPVFARGGFNDWAAAAEAQFFAFGDGVFNAQFEIEDAGTYDYKVADGGWVNEWGNPDVALTLDAEPVELSGGAALGGPNSKVVIPEGGCYNWRMVVPPGQPVPASEATLQLSLIEIFNALLARSVVRVYDVDDNLIAEFEGLDAFQRIELVRETGQSMIRRVEIVSLPGNPDTTSGIGQIVVDDFRMGTIPDVSPRTVSIFYSRPSGDYSATEVTITTTEGTETFTTGCVPVADGGFGCVAEFVALGGDIVTYQVINGGVPDEAGPITFEVNDARDNVVYTFEEFDLPILADLPAIPMGDDEVVLYYLRPDGDYTDVGLHLFPAGGAPWTEFTDGQYPFGGIDERFGAWFIIGLPGSERLTEPYSASPEPATDFPAQLGFVVHRGDGVDQEPDRFIEIARDGNIVFVTSGVIPVASTPPIPGAVVIAGMAAHWVSPDTILWDAGPDVVRVELRHAADGGIRTIGTRLIGGDGIFELSGGVNPLAFTDDNRHLDALSAWRLPVDAETQAADLAREQLVLVGFDADGQRVAATGIQTPLVLDALYADAAADATLGVEFSSGAPILRVWAPTANDVAVNLYDDPASDVPAETAPLTYDAGTGIWSVNGPSTWNRRYYTYAVNVYAPSIGAVVDNVVTDPYSVSLSTGSAEGRIAKSQIVDLNDADLEPPGWSELAKPRLDAPEDIVLYELHVRDFSILDETVAAADRGKYTAFAGSGAGVAHLSALADAGLTHVHVLPSFDIATVNEDASQRVEIADPVEALCAANPAAATLCDEFAGMTLLEIMTAEPGDSALPQQIVQWIRDIDGFNWGYDPFHYSVPEGSYASDPEGPTRIRDFRTMVKGLADLGLRTVMDVVYNHTNAAGNLSDKSVLDRIVPGYYHRTSEFTGAVLTDSCCPDTASEHRMMEKLIVDSTLTWARQYKVDGFRFDIMGFHSEPTMRKVRDALRSLTEAVDGVDGASIYLYGEGWNFGDVAGDRRFEQATQANVAGTGIGTFNDRIRDSIRGGGPFDSGQAHVARQGFSSGQYYDPNALNSGNADELAALNHAADLIRLSMAGALAAYEFEDSTGTLVRGDEVNYAGQQAGYTEDPQEIVNYAASHDGETLWDIGVYKHPTGTPTDQRVRAHNVAQSIVLLGQGIPFLHAGQDMLRSKSMDRNSFDSGDWFNRLDFGYSDNNFAVGEPRNSENAGSLAEIRAVLGNALADPGPAHIAAAVDHSREMLGIRAGSRLFRLRTGAQIRNRVSYHNTGPDQVPGLIVQSIVDGDKCTGSDLDGDYSKQVVAINASTTDRTFALFTDESFVLHPVLAASSDPVVTTAMHDTAGFFVPARTAAVFVQSEAPVDCGPLGADVYVRGSMNDFGAPDEARFDLRTAPQDAVTLDLDAALYFFRIADDQFEIANCGAGTGSPSVMLNVPYGLTCSASATNLQLDLRNLPAEAYTFLLDAADADNPVLTVSPADLDLVAPTVAITAPVDAATVAGNVAIRATATDNATIVATRFFVDGTLLGTDTTPEGDEYSFTWNTAASGDGMHVLTAQAEDDSGNVGTAAAVTVTVDSTLLDDDFPPTVTLNPVPAALTGTVTLTAQADDPQGGLETPTGVAEVRFFFAALDGSGEPTLIDTDSTAPYSVTWDTTTTANDSYFITAEAVDGAGNSATTDAQSTVVDNPGTYGADLFVCGILADCATAPSGDAQLGFLGNDTFGGTLSLAGSTVHEFRIVDSDGVTVGAVLNCGSESLFTPIVPGDPFTMNCEAAANDARLDLSREGAGGQFSFLLDASDAANPVLTVSSAAPPPMGAPGDVTPPTVAVTGTTPAGPPTAGVVLSGDQVILASATDTESPVARVEFLVDAQLTWIDTTAPYEAPWDTETVSNGVHELTARAVDAAGNEAVSAPLMVSVGNVGPYGVDMYPRGSWDPNFNLLPDQQPMDYLGSGVYRATLTLPQGTLRYKIASDDFDQSESNCNPPEDNTPAILTEPLQFLCSVLSANAKFDVSLEPPDTDYTFVFDASRSLVEPLATVSRTEAGPPPLDGDETPPVFTAALTLTPADDPVMFDVVIDASVTDNNAVASVQFLVDNEIIWADFTAPFQAPWDSTLVADGQRTITAIAVDANGNLSSSSPLTVNVDNPEFGPFDTQMFVRGAFVEDPDLHFGTQHPLVYLGDGNYEALVNIDNATPFINFKVADAGWTDGTNCGRRTEEPAFMALGAPRDLTCSSLDNGGDSTLNLTLNLAGQPQPADYRFTIDAADFPATRPTVTVTLEP